MAAETTRPPDRSRGLGAHGETARSARATPGPASWLPSLAGPDAAGRAWRYRVITPSCAHALSNGRVPKPVRQWRDSAVLFGALAGGNHEGKYLVRDVRNPAVAQRSPRKAMGVRP